jgi:hypothetical protein
MGGRLASESVAGFARNTQRGQAKVSGEWDLVCMGYNLKRMHLMMA